MECQHTKVYSNTVLLTCPPQLPWICCKCLEEGTDREDLIPAAYSYKQLKERKERSAKHSNE